jgi:hypothetical protein
MTVTALPGDLDAELVRSQRLSLEPTAEERALLRTWVRTSTAVDACLLR